MTPQPYGGTDTAFGAGVAAYREGQPITANPHRAAIPGEIYPGAQACWREGWLHAKHTAEHGLQSRFATLELHQQPSGV